MKNNSHFRWLVWVFVGLMALAILLPFFVEGDKHSQGGNSTKVSAVEKESEVVVLKVGKFWRAPVNLGQYNINVRYCGMTTPGVVFSLSGTAAVNDFFSVDKKRIEYQELILEVISVNTEEIRFKYLGKVEEKK